MDRKPKAGFYITTPLYYVNDLPHIGHAYTTLAADIFTRAMRLYGHEVRFLTGTDEHGAKVAQSAAARGMSPQAFADEVSAAFRQMWKMLNIQPDDFIRTTQQRHERVAQGVFKKLLEQGDISKGSYEGWYCTPCETFWTQDELGESKTCSACQRPVERLREETYFFHLPRYQQRLQSLYAAGNRQQALADFLSPPQRANEILSLVKGGLHELSVSRPRSRVSWGIPVPGDPSQTIYVWFEALINYISALEFNPDNYEQSGSLFKKWWEGSLDAGIPHYRIHLVGKEIYRFHTVTWPAMLLALNITQPSKVFAHGWWTVEGEKMSKSKGNVVNPAEVVKEVPLDAFRYYLFREMSFGSDGDFSMARLRAKLDGELANSFGNLHRRLVSMIRKYHSGRVTKKGALKNFSGLSVSGKSLEKMYEDFEFYRVLEWIYAGFVALNTAIDKSAPWKLFKEGKKEEIEEVVFDVALSLGYLAYALSPVCPDSSVKVLESLGLKPQVKDFETYLKGVQMIEVRETDPLFPRTDISRVSS